MQGRRGGDRLREERLDRSSLESQAVWRGLTVPGLGVSVSARQGWGRGPLWHLPDVPGRAGWPVSRRSHPSAAGREAGVDCTSRAFQFSGAKRPFSEAIAVGMARLGGLDPEFPVQNGSRQLDPCAPALGRAFFTDQQSVWKRSFAGVAEGLGHCEPERRRTSGKGRGLGSCGHGRLLSRSCRRPPNDAPAPIFCLPRLNKTCPNPSKWRESLGIRGRCPTDRPGCVP